jgi:hypothetical protein
VANTLGGRRGDAFPLCLTRIVHDLDSRLRGNEVRGECVDPDEEVNAQATIPVSVQPASGIDCSIQVAAPK